MVYFDRRQDYLKTTLSFETKQYCTDDVNATILYKPSAGSIRFVRDPFAYMKKVKSCFQSFFRKQFAGCLRLSAGSSELQSSAVENLRFSQFPTAVRQAMNDHELVQASYGIVLAGTLNMPTSYQ